jgi:hypothetical protein
MRMYEGLIIQIKDNRYQVVILRLTNDEPGCDTVMEHECSSIEEANIWLDDEMHRLTTGKGIWE